MSADYPSMTTAEIRSKFLNFFEERGLKLYPSSSLVPDDPSLLLANAGMNQFKEYYQGKKTMKEIGAISCQKCVRTNDIDCIGEDGRHLSFFEMLGDFSFGGVSKEQACAWAFELITKEFKLPLDRLYFTVFTEDDETHDVWRSLGVAEDHISRLGEDDNFWAAGPTGPCGPCSEIYFDMGEEVGCGSPDCKPGCDCDRFLEFWNLVFTQYDRQEDGSMPELPHRNLDTGMGLERMAAIMQHKTANYDGDLMQHLIKLGEEISGKTYDADDYSGASRSLRIIADHSRAVDFMISDGILPGNEGREYVLRRLLRRAVFHGRLLGIEGAFLTKFIDEVNAQMGEAYPELLKNVALVKGIVASEEERFSTTLDNGRVYLDEALAALADGAVLSGDVAFKLHDTFGFPIDLTVEIAGTTGHDVDMDGFTACMEDQKARARANAKGDAWGSFNDVWVELSDKVAATEFDGYDNDVIEGAKVVAIVRNGESVESAAAGEHVSQAGSLVTPEHLRFDFTHFEALSSEQLKAVEDLVNQQIFASKPVVTRVMGIDEAKAAGAVALFGEKYGDVVRVVSVGAEDQSFSRELCGGTHAANTAEIGLFKIISESSTGSNVRRIEAVTSKGALDYMADRLALVDAAAAALKCRVDEVPARVENLQAELRETSNKLKKALTGGSSDAISSAVDGAVELNGYKLVVAELQGLEAADLRNVWDTVHQKVAGPVACVIASVTEKGTPALLAAGSDDAVKAGFHAGNVIKQIAGLVDGRGGGRPNMAQAGGKNAAGIADALAAAKTALGA